MLRFKVGDHIRVIGNPSIGRINDIDEGKAEVYWGCADGQDFIEIILLTQLELVTEDIVVSD